MPTSIVLSNYSIAGVSTGYLPNKFWILGSRDGTNWNLVDSRTGVTNWPSSAGYLNFNTSASAAFTYFRIVMFSVQNSGAYAQLGELVFNGSIEGPNVTPDGRLGVGVSNPVQALEVAGSAVVAGTVSAGNPLMFRNALYNGDMRINQRGISTNWASPTAIGTSTTLNYSIDRINHIRGARSTGGGVAQLTLATTDQPFLDGLQYYLRFGRVSGNGATDFISSAQVLESRESYRFSGQPATFSLYYRTGSGFSGSSVTMALAYGTGIDQNGVGSALTNQVTQSISLSPSNAWQRVTLTSFIAQTSSQVLCYVLYTPTGTAGGFDYVDITGLQLEKGSVATPYEIRPYATELALCQRYFEKSFDITQTIAAGDAGNFVIVATSNTSAPSLQIGWVPFKVSKRTNGGTSRLYNPYTVGAAPNTTLRIPGGGSDININGTNISVTGLGPNMASSPVAQCYALHYTYDCEL
jgi:hypothetical protein